MSTTTIRFAWIANGVPADVDADGLGGYKAYLSDPTGAFGVERTDTSGVVVADATQMTRLSAGVYQHSFTDPAAGLIYHYYGEFTYGGQVFHLERSLSSPAPSGTTTLEEARAILVGSVLHIRSGTLTNAELDRAILAAGRRFVRASNAASELVTLAIPAGTSLVTVTSLTGLDTFVRDQCQHLQDAVTGREIFERPYLSLARRASDASAVADWPDYYAFPTDSQMYLYPAPRANRNLTMLRRVPFGNFSIGDPLPATKYLNIPDEWVHDVLHFGAKYYLLGGAPGHPDAAVAGQEFDRLIMEARVRFIDGRPGTEDRDVRPGVRRA